MDEFREQMYEIFLYETNGFLQELEKILLQTDTQPEVLIDSVDEIFRIMHTIKSSSAMVDLLPVSTLAHKMEDFFQFLRENKSVEIDVSELAELLLRCIDYMHETLQAEGTPKDNTALLDTISNCLDKIKGHPQPKEQEESAEALPEMVSAETADAVSNQLLIRFNESCDVAALRAFELVTQLADKADITSVYPAEGSEEEENIIRAQGLLLSFAPENDLEKIRRIILKKRYVKSVTDEYQAEEETTPVQKEEPVPVPEELKKEQYVERRKNPGRRGEGLMGVGVKQLDHLINLSGETIIASMEARHCFREEGEAQTQEALERLHRLILDMQETTMSLRMVTLGDTFHSARRAMHNMAKELDREVTITVSGEDNLMDKEIVQQLSSPLLHILRNAVEHGIEPCKERLAAGKSAAGNILLSARLTGDVIEIEVADDGRGIDPDRVLFKAVDKGLISREQAQSLTLEETYSLLLTPGFSTKEEISEYSGRGVGLDVVNTNLRKISGRLQITSNPPQGTKFILKVPLTLATLDAFIVRIGEERYIFPINAVIETFSPVASALREINGQDCVVFRENAYSIYSLDGKQKSFEQYQQGLLLLTDAGNTTYALYVDEILDRANVVVKPVSSMLKDIPGIMGCTVLGDGQVSLIIDNITLLKRLGKR